MMKKCNNPESALAHYKTHKIDATIYQHNLYVIFASVVTMQFLTVIATGRVGATD